METTSAPAAIDGLPPKLSAEGELEWSLHLAARDPGRALALTMVILAAGLWAGFVFRSPIAVLATSGVLVAATAEFLFPIRYRLTAAFAEARGVLHWRRIEWREVKRVGVRNGEIKLSPLKFGGPRDAFRGVVLRHGDGDQEMLLATIKRFREAASNPSTDAAGS